MQSLDFIIIFLILPLLSTICLFKVPQIESTLDTLHGNKVTNTTFLDNPTDELLVEALDNGIDLESYTEPKQTDLLVTKGDWTIEKLTQAYPEIIENKKSENSQEYLIKKSIVLKNGTGLNITNSKILLQSDSKKDNNPAVIFIYGKINIINSTIQSWDPERNSVDLNSYHPRSFLVAKDGGEMNVIGSEISYLGFSQGGIHTLFSSLAALNYYNTSGFIISNSSLAHNLYGFYSEESSKFKIANNEIFDNVGYGLDPHTGSKDFIIDSNHLFTNRGQAIICSFKCSNATISNNKVEYNIEGIGLHWLTNSSVVKNNIIKYNKGYGIFLKNNSYNNIIQNNTVIGNGYGIGLLDHSNENILNSNKILGNILAKDQIYEDENSRSNFIQNDNYR